MSRPERKRILFFAEAVTLAHVARPLTLAQSLDGASYEVHLASAKRYDFAFEKTSFQRWEIASITSGEFLQALAAGSRLYGYRTLQGYVEDDLRVIRAVRPDLIVGDFRLSLAVSAPLANVTYAALANAYWSPYVIANSFPLPELPITRVLGYRLTNACFQLLQPLIFAYHARPLNRLRRRYGFPRLGSLLDVYTHGDYTLYADLPDLIPTRNLPSNHRFLGHVDWSPDIPLPDWWDEIPAGIPVVYVNLGSSGPVRLLSTICGALAELPVTVVMATAGRWQPGSLPANVKSCDYLPGNAAVRRAALVICNGGSPSVYQSLRDGVPVIGIPANMDQLLSMKAVERTQTGILLRAGDLTAESLRAAVTKIMNNEIYNDTARQFKQRLAQMNAVERFRSFLTEVLATSRP
jgi:UDP:flavonoid glycosyltransferase YjiC (YdhE family)